MKIRKQLPRYKEPDPIPECELVDLWFTTHLVTRQTNVMPIIYCRPKYQATYNCRVQVSNNLSRIDETNNFSIQLSDLSIVGRCNLPQKHLIQVRKWIDLNRSTIQEFWDNGNFRPFIKGIRKL